MPRESFPSSYLCDCGHQSDFFENTIRQAKAMSFKKKLYLGDSSPDEHTIVFHKGRMIEILCPPNRLESSRKPQHMTLRPGEPAIGCESDNGLRRDNTLSDKSSVS